MKLERGWILGTIIKNHSLRIETRLIFKDKCGTSSRAHAASNMIFQQAADLMTRGKFNIVIVSRKIKHDLQWGLLQVAEGFYTHWSTWHTLRVCVCKQVRFFLFLFLN